MEMIWLYLCSLMCALSVNHMQNIPIPSALLCDCVLMLICSLVNLAPWGKQPCKNPQQDNQEQTYIRDEERRSLVVGLTFGPRETADQVGGDGGGD